MEKNLTVRLFAKQQIQRANERLRFRAGYLVVNLAHLYTPD